MNKATSPLSFQEEDDLIGGEKGESLPSRQHSINEFKSLKVRKCKMCSGVDKLHMQRGENVREWLMGKPCRETLKFMVELCSPGPCLHQHHFYTAVFPNGYALIYMN